MKYPFDSVKMLNKVTRLVSPICDKLDYSLDIHTQNFICETVDDEVCHSVRVTVHHKTDGIVFQGGVDNWTDEKTNRKRLKDIKNFVNSIAQ